MRPTSWILTVYLWLYGEVVWEQSVFKITASAYVFLCNWWSLNSGIMTSFASLMKTWHKHNRSQLKLSQSGEFYSIREIARKFYAEVHYASRYGYQVKHQLLIMPSERKTCTFIPNVTLQWDSGSYWSWIDHDIL